MEEQFLKNFKMAAKSNMADFGRPFFGKIPVNQRYNISTIFQGQKFQKMLILSKKYLD
jgi:hypothetical protein